MSIKISMPQYSHHNGTFGSGHVVGYNIKFLVDIHGSGTGQMRDLLISFLWQLLSDLHESVLKAKIGSSILVVLVGDIQQTRGQSSTGFSRWVGQREGSHIADIGLWTKVSTVWKRRWDWRSGGPAKSSNVDRNASSKRIHRLVSTRLTLVWESWHPEIMWISAGMVFWACAKASPMLM